MTRINAKIPAKNPVTGEIVEEGSEEKYDNHLIRLKELKESRISILEEAKMIPATVLNLIYPIGTIYSNGSDPRDPRDIFAWPASSWKRYGPGRSIMAATGNGATTDPWLTVPSDLRMILDRAGEPYGDYTHKLITEEMPSHTHKGWVIPKNGNWKGGGDWSGDSQTSGVGFTEPAGGDKSHNNTHPVIIAHVWIRES